MGRKAATLYDLASVMATPGPSLTASDVRRAAIGAREAAAGTDAITEAERLAWDSVAGRMTEKARV